MFDLIDFFLVFLKILNKFSLRTNNSSKIIYPSFNKYYFNIKTYGYFQISTRDKKEILYNKPEHLLFSKQKYKNLELTTND